jgi:trimethylamine--corrinoid protein Co-methyltransferase
VVFWNLNNGIEKTMKLTLFSDNEIKRVHNASIEILEKIGVHVPHEKVIELFLEAGADVNKEKQLVKIPEKLVMHCLDVCKKQFTIYGRDRTKKGEYGVGKRNYNMVEGEPYWIEDNYNRRFSTLEDAATAARLADALPYMNIVGAMSDAHEIPEKCRYVYIYAELFKNTTKPIFSFFNNRETTKYILELFTIVAGSKEEAIKYPFSYPFFEPISPLRFPFDGVDLLFETSRFNLPVQTGGTVQLGATGPVTLAGTMAQQNAEILAGNCVVQLINPGNPIVYGSVQCGFDMSTTQASMGGPEQAIMGIGMTQIGKYYNLPVFVLVGMTDSKDADAQAGLESGITMLCGAIAGADKFGSLGVSGADQGASLLVLMMQHEIISYVERMLKGIELSDEKLGVDIIEKAKAKGSFIEEDHTLKHFREELWFPQLLDRNFWQKWFDEGHKDMRTRCKEMKDRLLKEHTPEPLDKEVEREVDKLLKDAKKHLSN